MKVCTLASGSSGNSLLIETEETKILVDAGISLRQITLRLREFGIELSQIDAVIVTHEHSDHTAALPRVGIPVYICSSTAHIWKDRVQGMKEFDSDSRFTIRDLSITPFSVPHDALDPVGFIIESGKGERLGLVTDIGSVTGLVTERLKGSDILVIEFNHCSDILLYSHYPWDLKQRIKGRLGHLSNFQAGELLESLIHAGLKHVVLAHLSQVNNKPEAAVRAARKAVASCGAENDIGISVAPRKTIGEVIRI